MMKKSITLILAIALVGITTLAVSSSDIRKEILASGKKTDNVSTSPTDKNGYLEENEAKWE